MRRCEDEKIRYRPPLLEEPCAQTLSGKRQAVSETPSAVRKRRATKKSRFQVTLVSAGPIVFADDSSTWTALSTWPLDAFRFQLRFSLLQRVLHASTFHLYRVATKPRRASSNLNVEGQAEDALMGAGGQALARRGARREGSCRASTKRRVQREESCQANTEGRVRIEGR